MLFTPRLARAGHSVGVSAYYGLEGAPIMWQSLGQDIPILPGLGGEFGNQYIAGHASAFFGGDPHDGIVLSLMDVLAMSQTVYAGLKTVCWTPVDHDKATPQQIEFFDNSTATPIAMSRFGQERLEKYSALYCPHGVETDIFEPFDRAMTRKLSGVPEDTFVVGVVAANKGWPSRKSLPEILMAFARFREKHDDVVLYLHTEISGTVSHGVPIVEVAMDLGIPKDSIAKTDQYMLLFSPGTSQDMARVMNNFDVLCAPSAGEGFGIPIMEAAACGVPAIVTDFSAMPEVAGPAGWLVGGQKVFTGQRGWQVTPDVNQIYEALEDAYAEDSKHKAVRKKRAREHALNYSVDRVVEEHMLPALKEVEERFGERPKLEVVR